MRVPNRPQRGITQTPFLIVFIMLWVVTALVAYFINNKAEATALERDAERQKFLDKDKEWTNLNEKVLALRPVVGFTGEGSSDLPDPDVIQKELDRVNTNNVQPPINGTPLNLQTVITQLVDNLTNERAKSVGFAADKDRLAIDVKAAQTKGQQEVEAQRQATTAVRQEREGKQREYDKLSRDATDMETKLRQQLTEVSGRLETAEKEKRETEAQLKGEVALLKTRIAELAQVEERRLTDVPDGKIVRGLERDYDPRGEGYAFVFIDIGRKAGVKDGTKFEVFSLDKGGKRTQKGRIVVKKAFDDLSECAILDLFDARNPIVRDDLVANKFFEKGAKATFALVGTFDGEHTRYTKGEWKRIVEEHGHSFQDSVRANTQFCIVGDRPTDDAEQWRLRELFKVEPVTEQEVLAWFDYGAYTHREGNVGK